MLSNYFKTTVRTVSKNKGYHLLNLFGFATGIACAVLILLWVEDELTYDHGFKKRNSLYMVYENLAFSGETSTLYATSGPMAKALRTDIPGIENAVRLSFNRNFKQGFSYAGKVTNEQGYYADKEIFSMLSLPFLYGDVQKVFPQIHSLVISESMSKKFFGNADPTGKTMRVNNEQEYMVTGVFKDLPANSTLQFHWLAPFEIFEAKNKWLSGWNNNGVHTIVELTPGTDPAKVNKQLRHFLFSKDKQLANTQCFLFSMNDWHLYNEFKNGKQAGGLIKYVRLFSMIALIILLIACINFMNLSTARSEKRAREVGVRKVMGANKRQLVQQFLSESLWISFMAVLIAIALVYTALPAFNILVGKELSLNLLNLYHITGLIVIGLVTGLLAGSYPAFYLSAFQPVKVLKGIKIKTNISAGLIRKGLIVMQFSASVILIIGTIVIYQQVQHVQARDLGYNKDNLIYFNTSKPLKKHYDALRTQLLATGVVQEVGLSGDPLLEVGSSSDAFEWQGKNPDQHINIFMESVNPQYMATAGMELKAGRQFTDMPKADSANIIINESLSKLMGAQGEPGSFIESNGNRYQVIGIVKDFVYNDIYGHSEPVIFFCDPGGANVLTIRFKQQAPVTTAIAKTAAIIKAQDAANLFDFKFVDQDFNRLFKTEMLTGKLAGIFSILAILISCVGLLGLATFMAEQRTKEIGIRKVLGAGMAGIVTLFSKDFLRLVAIACCIAYPIAWWAVNSWLQNFAYRIAIDWRVFIAAGAVALSIALLTISFQAVKSALRNPVKALRSE